MSNCGSSRLPLVAMLGLVFVLTIQLADNRYIPYTPYYPVQPYHEGGAGYMGNGPPPLRGMIPYDHYQPVWTPHGTFFDQRRKVLRIFPGDGVPVIVDYDKRCSDGFIGVKKHPDHAQYYYACKSDCVIFGKCQDYQYFDANKGKCTPYPLPRFAPVCTKPGHFPIYSNCTLYYTCDCNLNSEIFNCPSGTIFSSAQGLCIDGRQCPPTEIAQGSYVPENCEQKYPPCLENGTFRSPMDCGLYYKCRKQDNDIFLQTRFKCPGDNFYDTKQELCLPQQQVSCDRIQIAHLVYPGASQKSYSPNYYPYVADSEEATDFTVAQPKRIDCSAGTTPSTSGEEIESESQVVPQKPARTDQNQQISGTTEPTQPVPASTTSEPTTTTTKPTTMTTTTTTPTTIVTTTTNQPTQPQITTTSSTTAIPVQPQPATTETQQNADDDTTTMSTTPASSTSDTSSTSSAPVTLTTSATTNSESTMTTTTEVTSTATPQSETTTINALTGTSTADDTSTTGLGSSPTSTGTTEIVSTTIQISTTEQTVTPTEVSTTEASTTTNSASTTENKSNFASTTEGKSTTDNFISTTEHRPVVTTELTTQSENTEDTSISTTQTGTSTTNNEDISTTNDGTEGIERASLDASTPSPIDTQAKTLHASNTNTKQQNTNITTHVPNEQVLRDSRSIDHVNENKTTKTKTPEDSGACCSQERMILDDELILDDSEEYNSLEEMESNEIESPSSLQAIATSVIRDNSVQNTSATENISLIGNTTQRHENLDVQSTTQSLKPANAENEVIKSHERRMFGGESVIIIATTSKVEQTTASTTEANKVTTTQTAPSSDIENGDSVEEYDSQQYVDEENESTTASEPLEQSTVPTELRTIETSTVNGTFPSTTMATETSNNDVHGRQILNDEMIVTATTHSTPTTETNETASTEEYDSVEYVDEDDTTTPLSISNTNTTEAPKLLSNKEDNIMIVAKNEHPVVKGESAEMLANVVEISTPRPNTPKTETPMQQNEIEDSINERQVLSDEVVINTTTISTTTQVSQVTTESPTSTSETSREYESNEIDDEELEAFVKRRVLSDEVIIPTTPNTTQIPITTTATETSTIALTTEISVHHTTEENVLSYEDLAENDINYDEVEYQERQIASAENIVATTPSHSTQQTSSTSTPQHHSSEQTDTTETPTIAPPPTTTSISTSTEPTTTQNPNEISQSDNGTHERLVLSDDIVLGTTPSQIQNEIETRDQTHISTPPQVTDTNTNTNTNSTQEPTVSTFSDIRQINLHMRETQNTTATNQKPVNNTNIIIGEGTCIENPNIPTLNLTIYGDINLHIRFCPRPCNETHVHNYEKLPIVDAVWDSNSSNKTMNLQAIS